ncbi:MAG: HlyD family efflux transporter periplasmic adaptor subunit [Candidatus Moranbacteria bacterium]|nr:HlyD family efflux transporter periplasmic adaptor subunit [Candidatus Moranbacteria bacterium]
MRFENTKQFLINGLYFTVVLIVSLGIATQALARKVNTYEMTKQPLFFSIEKERVVISNSVTGRVIEVAVSTGQHVKKGDLLVRLADDSLGQRISSLQSLAEENLSARTELALLESKAADYEIKAPRDGVVYQIHSVEGSYLTMDSPVIVLFADSNVKITGTVNQSQYAEIQKSKDLDVYSPRFEQIYKISFEGVGRVQPATNSEESRYEVKFRFSDANEGAAFIDGEGLEVISKNKGDDATRPSFRVAKLWNSLILGR